MLAESDPPLDQIFLDSRHGSFLLNELRARQSLLEKEFICANRNYDFDPVLLRYSTLELCHTRC